MWCAARGRSVHEAPLNWISPPGPGRARSCASVCLGGSFNPAHGGHLYVSRTALKRLKLDYVWWLVSPGNPLKDEAGMAPFAARLEGARAVAAHHPRLHRERYRTAAWHPLHHRHVTALQRRFPEVHFVWLMGSDNLAQFQPLAALAGTRAQIPMAVVQRPGSILASLQCAP